MKHYEATESTLEFSGRIASALVAHLNSKQTANVLEHYGLTKIDVNEWYNVNQVLTMINEIGNGPNATTNLVSIGMEAGRHFVEALPDEVQGLPLAQILQMEETMLHTQYRNGDPGYIRVQQVSDKHFIHDAHNSWPDDLVYGFVYSVVRHFRPANQHFSIVKDKDVLGQDMGGEFLRLHIHLS